MLKLIDSKLLANERYIMENVINGNTDKLNYNEWLERCIMDGFELGLFVKSEKKSFGNIMHQKIGENVKLYLPYLFALSILISLFELCLNINNLELVVLLCLAIPCMILNFTVVFIVFLVLINLIPFVRNSLSIASKYGYNSIISGHLKHTEKGKKEVHKLYSFSAFIADFGAFASKNPEEVVLWDYYLGYAQVFGLTDKILKTGYDKIIKNGSFQIDNINAISLKNINVNLNKN